MRLWQSVLCFIFMSAAAVLIIAGFLIAESISFLFRLLTSPRETLFNLRVRTFGTRVVGFDPGDPRGDYTAKVVGYKYKGKLHVTAIEHDYHL